MTDDVTKLFAGRAERFPEPDAQDTMQHLARAGMAAIPLVGGSINELLSSILEPAVTRRRAEWVKELADTVDRLESRIGQLDFENLGENEQFVSAVIQATRIAVSTHQRQKRRMLQNALFKIGTGEGPGDELQQVFFNAIEAFSPSHVTVLRALWSGTQELINKHNVKPTELGNLQNYQNLIRRLVPELERHDALVQCILTDLRNRGFSTLSGPNVTFPAGTVVTNVGIDFLHFLMEPEPKG